MSGAFEVAAGWLEEGTPEARALGEEICALVDRLVEGWEEKTPQEQEEISAFLREAFSGAAVEGCGVVGGGVGGRQV